MFQKLIFVLFILLLFVMQGFAQEWLVWDGSVLPDANDPAFEMQEYDYGEFGYDSTSEVIDDPLIAGNSLLEFSTIDSAEARFLWRMQDMGFNPENGATFMFRIKPLDFDTYDRHFELDIRAGGVREKVVFRGDDRIQLERSDQNATGLANMQYWHTFRVTYFDSVTNVYMDENPVPVVTGKTLDAAGDDYFRFGDGSGSNTYGSLIDWIMWDTTGVYAPGEGAAIPDSIHIDPLERDEIAFVSLPGKDNPDTPEPADADTPFINDLLAEGYYVSTVYSSSLESASAGLLDTLNNADLVIIGRSGSSSDFGGSHREAWNNISAPVLNLHLWAARTSRLNWLPTGSTAHNDAVGDTIVAKIELPDDPVFADATIAADSTMDWVVTPIDFMETTDGGNGTVLARDASTSNVFFVRWDPWVMFYDGAGDFAAGYRTLIGNGNDNTTPFNYYNFTEEAKQVYLNEVARMVDLPEPPEKPIGLGNEIVFVSLPGKDNPDTPEEADADKPFIDDLLALEYTVNTVYTNSLETASAGLLDTLNSADLVIIGRSGSSNDFGGSHKEAWNNISAPILNLHLWTARTNRLNWLPTGTTSHNDALDDTVVAKIELPDDPVFADATIAADSTMDWVVTPIDFMETTDGGNGTVLARDASTSNVFFVRWDPWIMFYDGAGDFAAGYRTLIGNGNDNVSGSFNYYNFTEEAKQVYLNEVARMVELPEPPEKPVGLGNEIVFVSLPGKDNPDTPEEGDADKPFIDDLIALEYTVHTVYSSSLSGASQGLVDTLNSADLVIIGRSGSSSDFGNNNIEDRYAWNAIRTPILNLHLWTARDSRLNWLPTGSTAHNDAVGDTIVAKIELPDDPVFADATIAAEDSTMDWAITPIDFMETTDGGNGTVLARDASSSNVLFVRWDAWAEFYEGAGDTCAGYRTLIGNGNDNVAGSFNYYNFTEEAKQVYLNEVARMVELDKPDKPTSIDVDDGVLPIVYDLGQNYPNPFNPTTNIKFSLPKAGKTTLKIYNTLGQLVTTLVNQDMNAGVHKVTFNASRYASGIYFYRIEAGDFVKVKKMMLIK